jgi:Protein of unknown function (DUF1761)
MTEKLTSGSRAGTTLRTEINYWAVAVAAAATLVASSVWYIVFGNAWLTLRGLDPSTADTTPAAWVMVAQFARNLVVAVVLAFLLRRLGTATLGGALRLGLLVWVGSRRWRSQARCFMSSTHWACTPSMSVTRSWRRSS